MIFEERPFGIKLTNPGNVDWYYSSGLTAYNSFEDVYNTIPVAIRLGKTVAIKTGDTVIEYWFASGTTDNDLVKKGADIDLSGYQLLGDYVSASTLNDYYTSAESDTIFQPLGNYVIPSDLTAYQLTSQKNSPNGYAGLNSSGLLPFSLFPDRLLGNVIYKGTYDGTVVTSSDSTLNGQPLPTASSGNTGYYFISTSGYTYSGLTFEIGDWIISNGSAGWAKIDNSDAVTTVFGRIGNVIANQPDYAGFYVNKTGDTITGLLNIFNGLNVTGTTYLNGNVGVGTTNPQAPLHIQSSGATQLRISYNDSSNLFSSLYTTSDGDFLVRANSTGGNVHIGNAVLGNATSILNVNGSITLEGASGIRRANVQTTDIGFVNNQTGQIRIRAGGTQTLLSDTTGIRIGTGTPSFPLDVNGATRITGNLNVQSGTITAAAGTTTVAPLKLNTGTNLTTPQNGAFEFDGTNLYFTVGGVRKTVTLT